MTQIEKWRKIVVNGNSWVLFSNGTCVIFLPHEVGQHPDLREEAIRRLKALEVLPVPVAELRGQGGGWVVNCGNDFVVSYVEHTPYDTRYDRIRACPAMQRQDKTNLKIVHVEIGRR